MTLLLIGLLIFGSVCGLRLRHFYKAINEEIPAGSLVTVDRNVLKVEPICGQGNDQAE